MLVFNLMTSELEKMQSEDIYLFEQAKEHWEYRRRLKHIRRKGTGEWWVTYDQWLSYYFSK